MGINVIEYKKNRLEDVEFYLRKINYKNLESENAIEGVYGDLNLIFNKKPEYRAETNKFILAIRNAYDHLVADGLEFANTRQEIDDAILEFELNLIKLIRVFKNNILNIFCQEIGYGANSINNDLSFVRIIVRDKNRVMDLSSDELHAVNELNGLREIFLCIYTLMYMIRDKRIKEGIYFGMLKANNEFNASKVEETGINNDQNNRNNFFEKKANLSEIKLFLEQKKIKNQVYRLENIKDYDAFIEAYNKEMEKLIKPKTKGK